MVCERVLVSLCAGFEYYWKCDFVWGLLMD